MGCTQNRSSISLKEKSTNHKKEQSDIKSKKQISEVENRSRKTTTDQFKRNKSTNQNTNIKHILISNRFDASIDKIKNDIQKQSLIEMRHDLLINNQEMGLLMEDAKLRFVKMKDNALEEMETFEKKIKNLKNGRWVNLSTSEFQKLIQQLQKQANSILKSFKKTIKEQIYDQIGNFKIYTLQKLGFFNNKKIKSIQLLYKASQHNFQVSDFWDACDGKSNTITFIKTEFGKIIGGYTPLSWKKSLAVRKGKYEKDQSKETFIFSVTEKHKLPLINGEQGNAIQHDCRYGPIFARDIIVANQITKSGINVGSSYNNGEYIKDNQQSLQKFSGQSDGYQFQIEEWQVHQIVFS